MDEKKECRRLKAKEYYLKNKNRIKAYATQYYYAHRDPETKRYLGLNRHLYDRLKGIKRRCRNPRDKKFKFYGGRGIQCLLTMADLAVMWDRDAAFLMWKPTLHREKDEGNYTVENCRFVEREENYRLHCLSFLEKH